MAAEQGVPLEIETLLVSTTTAGGTGDRQSPH